MTLLGVRLWRLLGLHIGPDRRRHALRLLQGLLHRYLLRRLLRWVHRRGLLLLLLLVASMRRVLVLLIVVVVLLPILLISPLVFVTESLTNFFRINARATYKLQRFRHFVGQLLGVEKLFQLIEF